MHAFRVFKSKHAPLTIAAAGLWASSSRLERPTGAEPAKPPGGSPQTVEGVGDSDNSAENDDNKNSPFSPPVGPMVAVYLDQSSVNKLKSHYPDAREGQLRKVVLQYGPSAAERLMYQHLFSGKAEVTVTGEASSFGRRALMAGVSHAGELVQPMSLSSAIDITPPSDIDEEDMTQENSGPLASVALIEQAKQAGATKQDSWQGTLPPLLAHSRQFPAEDGAFNRLKEPITVNGTICRADWVDGASVRCRDILEGGEKRKEDWQPSACSICAVFEVSPCSDIFTNRFIAASRRYDDHLKATEAEQEAERETQETEGGAESQRGENGEAIAQESAQDDEKPADASSTSRIVNTGGGTEAADSRDESSDRPMDGREAEGSGSPLQEEDSSADQMQTDVLEAMKELRECMTFHDM